MQVNIFKQRLAIQLAQAPTDSETDDDACPNARRRLVIDLDMPQLRYLISASLMLAETTTAQPHRRATKSEAVATIGEPSDANLNIRYTRRWGSSQQDDDRDEQAVEFAYAISAPSDTWLISGVRRGRFAARPNEDVNVPLVLVPLVTGRILLPRVEVRLAAAMATKPCGQSGPPLDRQQGEHCQSSPPAMLVSSTCETDYLSQALTVVVVAGVQGTTVVTGGGRQAGIAGEPGLLGWPVPVG